MPLFLYDHGKPIPIATVYVCGPMRGLPDYNFPAFDAARDKARANGIDRVISPADLDRESRELPSQDQAVGYQGASLTRCIRRDFEAVMASDALILLPGWDVSVGARAEIAIAAWRGLPFLSSETLRPMHPVLYAYDGATPYRQSIEDGPKRLNMARMLAYGVAVTHGNCETPYLPMRDLSEGGGA